MFKNVSLWRMTLECSYFVGSCGSNDIINYSSPEDKYSSHVVVFPKCFISFHQSRLPSCINLFPSASLSGVEKRLLSEFLFKSSLSMHLHKWKFVCWLYILQLFGYSGCFGYFLLGLLGFSQCKIVSYVVTVSHWDTFYFCLWSNS